MLERTRLKAALEPKLVFGQSIGQTLQFVATGNAELGFVARSQLDRPGQPPTGSRWLVPAELHDPIRQDAILLARAKESSAAKALLAYLKSPAGLDLVRSFGYEVP